ncbi:MAG: histidinol-phosphatase HisJ family protein [Firmicutes bacterium]|nr:histidinol-phosphatase HisJ family protein [Bacillota bacterium]
MIDYHVHTVRCCHATGSMEEYMAEAAQKGLQEIGFADHFPLELLDFTPETPVTMSAGELTVYLSDVLKLQERSAVPVRLGVEVDYLPGREALTEKLLARYPLDYCIGSIHFLGSWDFTHPRFVEYYRTFDVDKLYRRYFQTLQDMAESGLFDIVGHLDVVKKYAFFPQQDWEDLLRETCGVLAKSGICVELNTAGWRAPVKEAYPSEAFLRECFRLGVPVTLGSDAHCPKDVGAGLGRAVSLLKSLGFTSVTAFASRRRTSLALGD